MAETLIPAGVKMEIDDPGREDFGTHRREIGLLVGDYGGANVITVYGSYAFNEHLAGEVALSHLLGNFSDGQYATIGVTHVPVPEWRIPPFLSLGTGVIHIQPKGTLTRTRTAPTRSLTRARRARLHRTPLHRARRVQGIRGLHRAATRTRKTTNGKSDSHSSSERRGAHGAAARTCRGARMRPRPSRPPPPEAGQAPVVIEPQVERREVKPAKIDTENWEAGVYVGSLSVEDFEVNPVYGARIAYHITEDFFAEAMRARATPASRASSGCRAERPLLTDSERQFTYYSLGFGWNALPGEVFLGGKHAYNSAVYLTLGAGGTRFAGDDHFTLTAAPGRGCCSRTGSRCTSTCATT